MNARTQSLARLLRVGHWRTALVAVLVGGLVMSVAEWLVLRGEVSRSLDLVARTAAYSADAAVLFEDAEAAAELLRALVAQEHLESIEIVLADGRPLARVQAPQGWFGSAFGRVAAMLFDLDAHSRMQKDGRLFAQVHVRGDGEGLVRLLAGYGLGVGIAMLVTVLVVVWTARRLERDITEPLDRLARFTRSVREHRAFDRRAAASGIGEIDALGEDFNALLAEMQAHEAELLARQARLHTRNEALQLQAEQDALTGLPNRAAFGQRLQQAVARAAQRGGALGLMFVDADRFKEVNDTHGHQAGDRVLVEIALRLQRALRDNDLVARLGGDEFAILLEPLAERADAEVVARKIDAQMQLPMTLPDGQCIVPSVSIGLAVYPADGADAQALLRHADASMYDTKRLRRAGAPQP